MKTWSFPIRRWLSDVPISNPIERRLAALVQVILVGFIAIILIAAILNLVIAPSISWGNILIRSSIAILIIELPLRVLRRGNFRGSVIMIISLFFILETFAVITSALRETA